MKTLESKRFVYAFDVDHTLAVSDGPIPISSLMELRHEGHVVGLCGNWAKFISQVPDWDQFVSFIGPMSGYKSTFLKQLGYYVPASKYIMVGNCPAHAYHAVSDDCTAAHEANWIFISENDFAEGKR